MKQRLPISPWLTLGLTLAASLLLGCSDDAVGFTGDGGASQTGGTGGDAGGGATTSAGGGGEGASGGGGNNTAEPSRYPLELVSPREAGSLPSSDPGTPAMPSGHRIFKAYPGLAYEIRAVVIGGSFPYRFALSDAPAGMSIDQDTGAIAWPNPSGAASPTITVTDAEGTAITSSWSIAVTTSGFRFVDAQNGNDADAGTHDSPWQNIAAVKASGLPGEIVYFRGGTYSAAGMSTAGGGTWTRVELNGAYQPVQWIAYPGEAPAIDNGYSAGVDNGRILRFSGSDEYPVYLDGFTIIQAWDKGLQFGSGTDYPVFRRLEIHGIAEAIDGDNSAGIMTLSSYADASWYGAYQDIDFHDNAPGGIKQYSHKKVLWEDLLFRSSGGGPDLKSHMPRFEVRRCSFLDNSGNYCGLFGNMNFGGGGEGEPASGEIRYNYMACGPQPQVLAMDVNQDGMAGEIHLYRNTFVGSVRVRNTDSEDGPFHFTHNVIVNDEPAPDHLWYEAVSDPSRVTLVDNLAGTPADAIVDADGALQGTYATFLGTRGHHIP